MIGWIALVLPWRIAANGNSVLGIQGPGWLTVLLTLVPVGCTLFSGPGVPFTKIERIAASAAAAPALLVAIWKFVLPPSYATGRGIGLLLGVLSTACVLAAGAFARAGGSGAAADAPTLGMRLWKKLAGFLGSVSGKRGRELSVAIARRDELLRAIGEAALEAHRDLPEATGAIQAREALQKVAAEPGGANGQVRTKVADAKAKRAFGKLAQRVIDGGLPLGGQESTIAEVRAIDAKIRELS
jgi:hypothetical protein